MVFLYRSYGDKGNRGKNRNAQGWENKASRGASMERYKSLDGTNQSILHILSLYQGLTVSDLWFEIGESGTLEQITVEELQKRLEFLKAKGFVKGKMFGGGEMYRVSQKETEW